MKIKGVFLILLLCLGVLLTSCGEKTEISVENRLGLYDIFVISNTFYEETCFDALHQFEHLYANRGIPAPEYEETKLEDFTVYTGPYSTKIERIDVTFTFEYEDSLYMQSLVITDGHIYSSINSSPKERNIIETGAAAITLPDFLEALGNTDLTVFKRMKPDADLYGIEYAGMSDMIYASTDEVKRILVEGGRWSENRREDRRFDHAVPIIDIIGAVETGENSFRDDIGLQVYLD